MRQIFVLITILALSGCGLARIQEQKEKFAEVNNLLVGKTYDDMVKARGVPTREATLSTGGKVVEYSKSSTTTSGGGSYAVPTTAYIPSTGTWVQGTQQQAVPVRSHTSSCTLNFVISPSGIVETWKAEGNACY